MNRINTKVAFALSIATTMLLYFIIIRILSEPMSHWTLLTRLPLAFTIQWVFVGMFIKWFWRIPQLQGWLVNIPDISGSWKGKVKSTFIDPKTKKVGNPIDINVLITQTLYDLSIQVESKEMISHSYIALFDIDTDIGKKRLCYSYTSKPHPDYRDESQIHDGTVLLDMTGSPVTSLKGEYWTTRKTTGRMELEKVI